ncbi:MAG TPA: hypothetical protein VE961_21810 [Pyrinomonadaceae bacterium]|nr:hypothetical protein [Pyrinomonadaceae bacterium]
MFERDVIPGLRSLHSLTRGYTLSSLRDWWRLPCGRVNSSGMTLVMLRYTPFKVILPTLYFLLTALFIGGIIFTIAEGPNPFGFLFEVVIYPAALLDFVLPRSSFWSRMNEWVFLAFVVLVNLATYFALGSLIDYFIRRSLSGRSESGKRT